MLFILILGDEKHIHELIRCDSSSFWDEIGDMNKPVAVHASTVSMAHAHRVHERFEASFFFHDKRTVV